MDADSMAQTLGWVVTGTTAARLIVAGLRLIADRTAAKWDNAVLDAIGSVLDAADKALAPMALGSRRR